MRRIGVVLAVMLAMAACSRRAADEHQKRIAELEAESRNLRQQVADLQKKLAAEENEKPEVLRVPSPISGPKEPFLRVEDSPAYRNLSATLTESNRQLSELRSRMRALEEQIAVTTDENQKLGNAQRDLQSQLAQSNDSLEAARRDLTARDQRLQSAEEAMRKLKADNTASLQKSSQFARVLEELEDIQRRREAAANNIYGRYRDLAESLRSLAVKAQSSNEGAAQTDLSRIQQLVSMAEEDMRQLRNLNAQAARANKRLAGLKP